MAIDVDSPMVSVITVALQEYVIANPDATLQDCMQLIMSYGLTQEDAQEAIGLLGDEFSKINGSAMTFDEVKIMATTAALIPVPDTGLL
jgi:hypothetical protein